MAQLGLWMLTSILVIGVGSLQPKRRDSPLFGWLLLAALLLVSLHYKQFAEGSIWLVKASIILTAASFISERGEFRWLRQAVIAGAWFQIPVLFLQAVNATIPWTGAHAGLAGTVIKRGACSILLGAASILATRKTAWTLGLASLVTGSLGGVPSLLRLIWKRKIPRMLSLIGIGLSFPFWIGRLAPRLHVWSNLVEAKWNVWHGLGFGTFPLGFQDDTGDSLRSASLLLRDLHSTWLDFIARFGWVGLGILIYLAVWVIRRTRSPRQRWFLVLALFAGSLQSAEAFPAMIALGLVWWIGLNEIGLNEKESSSVYPLSRVS